MEEVLLNKWAVLVERFHELTDQLMDPSVASQPAQLRNLSKERTELEPVAALYETYRGYAQQLEEARQILADPSAGIELHNMAMEESAELERRRTELEAQVKEYLIPKDPRDEKSLVVGNTSGHRRG